MNEYTWLSEILEKIDPFGDEALVARVEGPCENDNGNSEITIKVTNTRGEGVDICLMPDNTWVMSPIDD